MQKSGDRQDYQQRVRAYWKENQRLIVILLAIWFVAGYLHVPFARVLNNVHVLTGFPLGYYLASQLSLVVFVVLIFTYALVMNRIERKYDLDQEE